MSQTKKYLIKTYTILFNSKNFKTIVFNQFIYKGNTKDNNDHEQCVRSINEF